MWIPKGAALIWGPALIGGNTVYHIQFLVEVVGERFASLLCALHNYVYRRDFSVHFTNKFVGIARSKGVTIVFSVRSNFLLSIFLISCNSHYYCKKNFNNKHSDKVFQVTIQNTEKISDKTHIWFKVYVNKICTYYIMNTISDLLIGF